MEGQEEGRAAFRQKGAEIVVAALFLLAGAIVVYDSIRLGSKWADDGPQAVHAGTPFMPASGRRMSAVNWRCR